MVAAPDPGPAPLGKTPIDRLPVRTEHRRKLAPGATRGRHENDCGQSFAVTRASRPPPCGRFTSVGGTTRRNNTHSSSGTSRPIKFLIRTWWCTFTCTPTPLPGTGLRRRTDQLIRGNAHHTRRTAPPRVDHRGDGISTFAAGLEGDFDAVTAGLTTDSNSGPVEGAANRIKMPNGGCSAAPDSRSSGNASSLRDLQSPAHTAWARPQNCPAKTPASTSGGVRCTPPPSWSPAPCTRHVWLE